MEEAKLLFAGTSSFGMSGVNAHAILSRQEATLGLKPPKQAALPWRMQRCWATPVVSLLLTSAEACRTPTQHLASFACRLDSAWLAYLYDHR